jgi:hypothetical protein
MRWWQRILYIVTGSTRRAYEKVADTKTQVIEMSTGDWFDIAKRA